MRREGSDPLLDEPNWICQMPVIPQHNNNFKNLLFILCVVFTYEELFGTCRYFCFTKNVHDWSVLVTKANLCRPNKTLTTKHKHKQQICWTLSFHTQTKISFLYFSYSTSSTSQNKKLQTVICPLPQHSSLTLPSHIHSDLCRPTRAAPLFL